MKTPAFWYEERGLLAHLLSPLGLFWRAGNALRHAWATPYRAKIPVICVGNIVTGGSGKTPTALALAEMLIASGHKPGFVTRGYGGKNPGPVRVILGRHSAQEVGDEALLLARVAPVWVGHDRAAALKLAEKEVSHVILDDGLQNPSVLPNLSLLVIDGEVGFGNGLVMPAGPLRETYESAMSRITAVVLVGGDEQRLGVRVQCPLLRARYEPQLATDFPRGEKFFAFAGIARPEKFYATCRKAGLALADTEDFTDHHPFTAREIANLQAEAKARNAVLLTTEKDWVRLPASIQPQVLTVPIKLTFEDSVAVGRLLTIQPRQIY
jgi:tetraacyldisaccharide 4'-kinase